MTSQRKGLAEPLDLCPYNITHVLRVSKLADHVMKCRSAYIRNYADKGMTVPLYACFFNKIHQVPDIELEFHHEHCPNKDHPDETYFIPEPIRLTAPSDNVAFRPKPKPSASDYIPPPDPDFPAEDGPYKEACPAAHIGLLLPKEARLLPRKELWDKINQIKDAQEKERIAKIKAENDEYLAAEKERRIQRAKEYPAYHRAQQEALKKEYEAKKVRAIEERKKQWEEADRRLKEALENRRLEMEERARLEERDLITFD